MQLTDRCVACPELSVLRQQIHFSCSCLFAGGSTIFGENPVEPHKNPKPLNSSLKPEPTSTNPELLQNPYAVQSISTSESGHPRLPCRSRRFWFRVWGVGFRVWGLGFGVAGRGFRAWGFWKLRISRLGFKACFLDG